MHPVRQPLQGQAPREDRGIGDGLGGGALARLRAADAEPALEPAQHRARHSGGVAADAVVGAQAAHADADSGLGAGARAHAGARHRRRG